MITAPAAVALAMVALFLLVGALSPGIDRPDDGGDPDESCDGCGVTFSPGYGPAETEADGRVLCPVCDYHRDDPRDGRP